MSWSRGARDSSRAPVPQSAVEWEACWAPHDEATYAWVLARLAPGERVLDIGAGDLRLAVRLAERGCVVTAIERERTVLERGLRRLGVAPGSRCREIALDIGVGHLTVVLADASAWPFPPVESAVLLMRHCTRFGEYIARLRAVGCRRVFTNVRWRCGVEEMRLDRLRPFAAVDTGWWACTCGAVGFAAADPALIDAEALARVQDVENCPQCSPVSEAPLAAAGTYGSGVASKFR